MRVRRRIRKAVIGGVTRGGMLASMELVAVLPILLIVLLGLFEFSLLFTARSSVVEASRAGARLAAMPGSTEEDVEFEVRRVLRPRLQEGLKVTADVGLRTGDVVAVGVSVPMRAASPDLLWPIGFGLRGRDLFAETRMTRE